MRVSCVLPTTQRAAFIPGAIQSYQSQTYGNRELIILDNGDDGTEHLIPGDDPSIRYERIAGSLTTGEMRNACNALATGEVICHFDSDDWSAPERVEDQILRLGPTGMVTGYASMFFYDVQTHRAYYWTPPPQRYAVGTSLCYRRDWWGQHPFPAATVGEDHHFFSAAVREVPRLVTSVQRKHLMVARIHTGQTCPKSLNFRYQPVPWTDLPAGFPVSIPVSIPVSKHPQGKHALQPDH